MHLLKWTFPDGPGGRIEIELEQDSTEYEYAILSHRWGKVEDEVLFQDMLSGSDLIKAKVGYAKLEGCCRQAHQDGHNRVWTDTCCIDKASSAELSEAITSMYSYYENSQVCYAFLNDIEKRTEPPMEGESARETSCIVSKSVWFERGWTLQELIAPQTVKFFDASWTFLGEKNETEISNDIEKNSGIHSGILAQPKLIRAISVSSRMSWAAQRRTTRIEDRAYSFMGIFGVYMSPIYGEGHNAFIRLQEIMRISNDHTLFAWTLPPPEEIPQRHTFEHVSTMLALSPDQFAESSGFFKRPYNSFFNMIEDDGARLDYATTNAGLSISLPIIEVDQTQQLYAAILECAEEDSLIPPAILLHTSANTPRGYYWRANTDVGPIERIGNRWFQHVGRETLRMTTVYILPKLSTISQDHIEPHWNPLKPQKPKGVVSVELPAPADTTNPTAQLEIRRILVQAEDPYLEELQYLSEARRMIYGQAVQLYEKQLERPRMFPEDFIWQPGAGFLESSANLQMVKRAFEKPGITVGLISGVGGIGKTELAMDFAHRCRDENLFSSIIWIDASTFWTTLTTFQQIAEEIGLVDTENDDLSELSHKVLQWFDGLGRFISYTSRGTLRLQWLLLFDGIQDYRDMEYIWQPYIDADTGRILVTSRVFPHKKNARFDDGSGKGLRHKEDDEDDKRPRHIEEIAVLTRR